MINLNEFQKDAVKIREKNTLLVAAPGSGKTTVIVNRVVDLIDRDRIEPDKICIITFTKKAALNMKDRFQKMFKGQSPFFGTFHSLFYRILRSEGFEMNIISETEKERIIKKILHDLTGKAVNESKRLSNNIYKMDKVMKLYKLYKLENSCFDFDDLEDEVIKLFEREDMIEKYSRKYTNILVDEFQDCNDKQIYMLKKFKNSSIFAVGDEDQCIYTFRGSNPEYMVTFDEHFKDGIKLYLPINYRCSRNIVLMSKNLIKYNKKRNDKDINYFREKDGDIKVLDHEHEDDVYRLLIDEVKGLKDDNTCGILMRTNKEIIPILYFMFKNNIAVNVKDELSFMDFHVVKSFIDLMKFSLDFSDKIAFVNIAMFLSKIEKETILEKEDMDVFKICRDMKISLFKRRRLFVLQALVNILRASDDMSAVRFFQRIPYYNRILNFKGFSDILKDLDLDDYKICDILKFLEYIKKSLYNEKSPIIVSTIHGIKGMEFDEVHILNACEDFLPHKSSSEDVEEERRIFYIGVTRAKDKLNIHYVKNYMGREREKSRFLRELFE